MGWGRAVMDPGSEGTLIGGQNLPQCDRRLGAAKGGSDLLKTEQSHHQLPFFYTKVFYTILFFLSANVMCSPKQTMNVSCLKYCVCKAWYIISLYRPAPLLSKRASVLHLLTWSWNTLFYFEFIYVSAATNNSWLIYWLLKLIINYSDYELNS